MTTLHEVLPALARWREEVNHVVAVTSNESADLADAISAALSHSDDAGDGNAAHALVGLFYELQRTVATVAFEAYPAAVGEAPRPELLALAERGMLFAARILLWAQRDVARQIERAERPCDVAPSVEAREASW